MISFGTIPELYLDDEDEAGDFKLDYTADTADEQDTGERLDDWLSLEVRLLSL